MDKSAERAFGLLAVAVEVVAGVVGIVQDVFACPRMTPMFVTPSFLKASLLSLKRDFCETVGDKSGCICSTFCSIPAVIPAFVKNSVQCSLVRISYSETGNVMISN